MKLVAKSMLARTAIGSLLVLAHAAGCVETTEIQGSEGNPELSIARFAVDESDLRTTVVGLDAEEREVARLDLVHGYFLLTPPFTDDYEAPGVDGRRLSAVAHGQQMLWETAGYEPTLELPAQPPEQWALAAFLADPHVKVVLDRWQIGFEAFAGADEVGYTSGSWRGDSPATCGGSSTCGTAYYGTVNTCGGGAAALTAARLTQRYYTNPMDCDQYFSFYDQVLVSQCCPSGSGGQSTTWFAQKACPSTSSNATSCGTRTNGACKGCPTYPTPAGSSCSVGSPAFQFMCNGSFIVYQANFSYTP